MTTSPTRPRIVVGIDHSTAARRALRWAFHEAELRRATLQVVHVWSLPVTATTFAPPPYFDAADLEAGARAELDGLVDAELARHPTTVPVERVLAEGSPGRVLVEIAADADLLVLGDRRHHLLSEALLGSVSRSCVHHATCPVVLVPPVDAAAAA